MDATEAAELMIEHHQNSSDIARALAVEAHLTAPDCEQVLSGIWTIEEAEKFNLADRLRGWLEDEIDDMPVVTFRDSLRAELCRTAFNAISWPELARSYIANRIENGR